ncbi:VOC family protein [Leucothrix pacifica]|uniref:VOC family protein n=1 Tax=Leucothrix pacifica TaxID=1247513 RepID=A0A317CB48_9GAMM|nr:VOC family protein [Leucothrix pacifica]PWQ93312.1 VOC family protein [Leucothrix pacifica]
MSSVSKVAVWFDIPVTDMERAKQFYSEVFDFDFQDMDMNGMKMAMIGGEETDTCGMLVQGEGYEPSAAGQVVYFGSDDLAPVLARAVERGSEVHVPKTNIGDGMGYFSLFLDSEGNRIGLYSMN